MTTPTPEAWARALRIDPQPAYSPHIGVLVEMLTYARLTTLQAVEGMDRAELNTTYPDFPHSVALQLAHRTAAERAYQYISFQGTDPFAEDVPDYAPYLGAMTYGEHGPVLPRQSLEKLLRELEEVRRGTLAELARRDDAWLAERLTLPGFTDMNHHWIWFHVMEEELSDRGQIRLLRQAVLRAQAREEAQPDSADE
ncbi:DinB family protein [Deinococcus rubellus]|uniref:DinB family protein n=1 Tax=Deinococcus rubellus TaxID=1889240 RepID=A0ABY5YHU4_9DEIO|nr:DinB family protein [Deinococcus rubellus]UWX63672.1 DinB family protein [Deinococcus rubellus]